MCSEIAVNYHRNNHFIFIFDFMQKNALFFLGINSFLLVAPSCHASPKDSIPPPPYPIHKQAVSSKSMVVSAHPLATQAGIEILKQGGNAVDASVAVQFALAVVYPQAGNIGGGGFMVLRTAAGKMATLDFRETAPAKASRDMYLDKNKNVVPALSTTGHLAAGVPGSVAGMYEAHRKYGKLRWETLLAPAIRYAEKGIKLTTGQANSLNKHLPDLAKAETKPSVFTQVKNKKKGWQQGDTMQQADLAAVLRAIQKKGRDGFYKGFVADKIVAEMQRGNGIISYADLKNYQAKWRTPLVSTYKNYMLIGMPPPSSGGVILAQLLRMIAPFSVGKYGFHSPEAVHLMVECERRAYADRAEHLGDPDFWNVPLKMLLDSVYIKKRMASFEPQHASLSSAIKAGTSVKETEHTTHFTVVDAQGNAVAITTTLNDNYGNKVTVGDAGFILNNEMDDFSSKPGVPNMYGLIGNEANAIAPKKRMLSAMTPTIILKDKKLFMTLGSPGGGTIITSVFQTFLNVVEFKLSLLEAVHAKRFHHQWLPDHIFIEEDCFDKKTSEALQKIGHKIERRNPIGRVEAIMIRADGNIEGVGDNRGDDDAQGF